MRTAGASIAVRAPREQVFEFHGDSANLARVMPSAVPLRAIGPSRLGPAARPLVQAILVAKLRRTKQVLETATSR